MKKLFWLLAFNCLFIATHAQDKGGGIKGTIIDTTVRQPISDASVTVLQASDSSLVTFSRSNKSGYFQIGYLGKGNYRLLVTHVAYHNFSRYFSVTDDVKSIDLGIIPLTNKSVLLDKVTVTDEKAPVTIKHDTIEFNAGSFKTKPNAVVEDLLKKLPGIQVDKDGKIKANGQEVKKVLVDGKQFFGNDPKVATKNLPANIVDKVQVFDKKSDQSQFTGFDDGNSQRAINLTIRPDKKNGLFGRATAGAGNDSRYEGKFNLNRFTSEKQISAIGMANNTNKQGFSFSDILNFAGGPESDRGPIELTEGALPLQGMDNKALTTTWAGGINFNDTWNKRADINGSYFFSRIGDLADQKIVTQNLLPGNQFNRFQSLLTSRRNENHRLDLSGDYKLDSMNSLKLIVTGNFQQSNSQVNNSYYSLTAANNRLNEGISISSSSANGYSLKNDVLWRHKFSKKGRTFSADLSFNSDEGKSDGKLYSINSFFRYDGTSSSSDTIDQVNNQRSSMREYEAVFSYTEPFSKKSLLEFKYHFYQANSMSGKNTFEVDQNTGKYSFLNEMLTNDFSNTWKFSREGIAWRWLHKNYNFSLGSAIQQSFIETGIHFLSKDSSFRRSFVSIQPNALLQYEINKYKHLRLNYNTNTRPPSTSQPNPIMNNTDPLNIKKGNPDLLQEYYHRFMLNYGAFDPFRRTNFMAMLNFTFTNNKVVNDDQVDPQGVRTSTYTNAKGTYNLRGFAGWGLPVRKLKSNLNLNTTVFHSKDINFLNGIRDKINSWSFNEDASLNFIHKSLLDITAGINLSYNTVHYSLTPQQNSNYWNEEYSLDGNIYFPFGFSIANEFSFIANTGYSSGFNRNVALWNAGFAKQMFKDKKIEIKFQVFDILNQNVGISRTANQNYIQDIQTRILNRYFLLSLTYNISRFAGKSAPVQQPGNVKVIGERNRM